MRRSFCLQSCFCITVETQGNTASTTVVDVRASGQPANAQQVALALDVDGFRQWVAEVLPMRRNFYVGACLILCRVGSLRLLRT